MRVIVEYEPDALADVPPRALDGGVAVDVGELPEAEAVVVLGGWVREAVNVNVSRWRVEDLNEELTKLKHMLDKSCKTLRSYFNESLVARITNLRKYC